MRRSDLDIRLAAASAMGVWMDALNSQHVNSSQLLALFTIKDFMNNKRILLSIHGISL